MIPRIIFIVPYRNRVEHKQFFTKYMEFIMEDYKKEEFETYFVHQCDNRPFNRGAMKNLGFLAMYEKYPNDYKNITFVFHDVDTLPYTKNLLPYETTVGIVKHFYGFHYTLGGIFSIKGQDFEKVNGFPNFWGWGMEDNMMQDRVVLAKLHIDRTTFFPIGSQSMLQFVDGIKKAINKKEVAGYVNKSYPHGLNMIRNTKWTFKDEYINVTSFTTESEPSNLKFEEHNLADPNTGGKIRLTKQERFGTNDNNPIQNRINNIITRNNSMNNSRNNTRKNTNLLKSNNSVTMFKFHR